MTYQCIQISISDSNLKELLIHQLDQYGVSSIVEETSYLQAFFELEHWNQVSSDFKSFIEKKGLSFILVDFEDKNWNEEWEKSFKPVLISEKCFVRAPFHAAYPNPEIIDIIVEPKLAFGTAHHETTHMMMEQMMQVNMLNKKVLDYGAGTAILSILAEKLGASKIFAIDNDPKSIENSFHNTQINRCKKIEISQKTLLDFESESFDIILANINRKVLLESSAILRTILKSNGHLFISGILEKDEQIIRIAFETNGFLMLSKHKKGEWLCFQFK